MQLPIFTAGRIAANIAANDARLETAAAAYDKALLQALEDVEDAYGLRYGIDRRAVDQAAALAVAEGNGDVRATRMKTERKTLQDVSERAARRLRSP